MSAIKEIRRWLSGKRNYEAGRLLYEKYGRNHNLKRIFTRGPNNFNTPKLLQELQMILNRAISREAEAADKKVIAIGQKLSNKKNEQAPGSLPKSSDFIKTGPGPKKPIRIDQLPPRLRELAVKKGDLYREVAYLHSQLLHLDEVKRKEACRRIIENGDKIRAIWEELDYYHDHGKEKPIEAAGKKIELPENPVTLHQQLLNLRSRLSKARRDPQKNADKINELESLIRQTEERLGK